VSTPTKFVIHGWRVLLNRISTKEHLYAKGIINADACLFAYGVWTSIYRWLGFEGAFTEAAAVDHFMQHG
jgi:hypothetical protein